MEKDSVWTTRVDGGFKHKDGSESRYILRLSFRKTDPTDLNVEIDWVGNRRERHAGPATLLKDQMNFAWLSCDNQEIEGVELIGLTGVSTDFSQDGPHATRPDISAIQYGMRKTPEPKDLKVHTAIQLYPSSLFTNGIFEQHYTGEIKLERIRKDPIVVTTSLGELTADETYTYHSEKEFGNRVRRQIGQSTLRGEFVIPAGQSLHTTSEKLEKELAPIKSALSLCLRKHIKHYEIRFLNVNKRSSHTALYRSKLYQHDEMRSMHDVLIEPRSLVDGGLQRLASAIDQYPSREDLIRAIEFLASSFDGMVENSFFMAFSAMETVINLAVGDDEAKGLSKKQQKTVRHALYPAIEAITKELGLDADSVKAKLPELYRPSLATRVNIACEKWHPQTNDLWPDIGFHAGLSCAAKVRNGLFHAADYSDGFALSVACVKIQTFTERLLLRLLDWPDSSLNPWRDQHLKRLNQS